MTSTRADDEHEDQQQGAHEDGRRPDPPPPAVRATGLGLRTRSGWVFRHVDLDVARGQVVELVGSGGTGRTMLLLALTGRARHTTGELEVLGTEVQVGRGHGAASRGVRGRTAVASAGDLVVPEGLLTVAESADERRRWEAGRGDPVVDLAHARALVGLRAADSDRVDELAAVERTLLSIALALHAPHDVLVVDDLDVGLRHDEQVRVERALLAVAGTGATVLAATARTTALAGIGVVHLPARSSAHPHHAEEAS